MNVSESAHATVRILRLDHAHGILLPTYETEGASGADVRSAEDGPVSIEPGERASLRTGLIFEIPTGWEIQVRPRSGLAFKHGLTVVNAPGTIDSDYRGEVRVLLVNLGSEKVTLDRGERIAQLVLAPVARAAFEETGHLSETRRGAGGFGSTGTG